MSPLATVLERVGARVGPRAGARTLPLPAETPGRTVGLWCLLRYVQDAGVAGDLVECGVGYGHTFYLLGRWADLLGLDRTLWGFDSFRGFPPPTAEDASPRAPRAGEYGDATAAHVRRHFDANYLGPYWERHVRLVPGWFDATLADAPVARIALLHLDCELHASYAVALDRLAPRLAADAVLLYDDYASRAWPGATAAVNARLDALGHVLLYSRLMNRYLSVSAALAADPTPVGARLLHELAAAPIAPEAAHAI